MDTATIKELLGVFGDERLAYPYFKDRYALMLLARYCGAGQQVSTLKRSPFQGLLKKPCLKTLTARHELLSEELLASYWPEAVIPFTLSYTRWSRPITRSDYKTIHKQQSLRKLVEHRRSYYQTSRVGANFVIQLNFPSSHKRWQHRIFGDREDSSFNFEGHPSLLETLAWARIDYDPETEEALIEEIQNDWIREVKEDYAAAKSDLSQFCAPVPTYRYERWLKQYTETELPKYESVWQEAILSAAIEFLFGELGVKRIWYHSFDSCTQLKRISFGQPPKSIYTKLPKKFCFRKVNGIPDWIAREPFHQKERDKLAELSMFRMEAPGGGRGCLKCFDSAQVRERGGSARLSQVL